MPKKVDKYTNERKDVLNKMFSINQKDLKTRVVCISKYTTGNHSIQKLKRY